MSIHTFDAEVATEFGVIEAIIIKNFQYWILHNRRNRQNLRMGQTWTYNSVRALLDAFPYMGKKQLTGALKRLQDAGVLVVDNFNSTQYDRTTWYSFADEERWLPPDGKTQDAKRGNGVPTGGQPIPDLNTFSKPDETNTPPSPEPEPENVKAAQRASEHEGIAWPWDTETFWEAWHGWREYKRVEFKFRYKGRQSEQAALNLLKKLSGDDEAVAHAILLQSKANGWSGLFNLKIDNHATHQGAATHGGNGHKGGISAARVDAIGNW